MCCHVHQLAVPIFSAIILISYWRLKNRVLNLLYYNRIKNWDGLLATAVEFSRQIFFSIVSSHLLCTKNSIHDIALNFTQLMSFLWFLVFRKTSGRTNSIYCTPTLGLSWRWYFDYTLKCSLMLCAVVLMSIWTSRCPSRVSQRLCQSVTYHWQSVAASQS